MESGRRSASHYGGRGLRRWWGEVLVSALTKKVRAAEHHRPTMAQDLWVYRVLDRGP
jgi:hypothetical protein